MLELQPEQISYLRKFLVRHYVRYEDVQLELIDHLASAIEAKMNSENLSFEKALEEVYKGFGVGGFAKIVREKEKSMLLFWRKHIWKSFLKFLQPPLLFIGIGLFFLFYFLQMEFQIFLFHRSTLLIIIAFFIAVFIFYKLHVKEETIERYLFLKSYYSVASMVLFTTFYLIPSSCFEVGSGESMIDPTMTSIIISSLYFTINLILLYILTIKIPQSLHMEMKSTYKKYMII